MKSAKKPTFANISPKTARKPLFVVPSSDGAAVYNGPIALPRKRKSEPQARAGASSVVPQLPRKKARLVHFVE